MQGKVCIQCNEFKPITAFQVSFAGENAKMGFTQNINHKHRCKSCYALRDRIRTKQKFLALYGGQCSCCGQTDPRFLTLDHVKNDGNEHRKDFADSSIMMLAIRNFQPERFQILCYNCNCGKSTNGGVCPHKDKTLEEHLAYVEIMLENVGKAHVKYNPEGLSLGPKTLSKQAADRSFASLLATLSPEAAAKVAAILNKS